MSNNANGSNQPSVAVITATIGAKELLECIKSVAAQSYSNIVHWIVVDGADYEPAARKIIASELSNVRLFVLPENTGGRGYHGHRIYAAMPFLVETDFVSFLDEDNLYEPEHIERLMDVVSKYNLDWAYSLRKIVDRHGQFICLDDCDSLGIWGQWYSEQHHIDANCYLLKREMAIAAAPIWNRKGYSADTLDPDKALCRWLVSNHIRGFTSGAYTVNYRLGSTDLSASPQYFIDGNIVMKEKYKKFPWREAKLDYINTFTRRISTSL